MENPTPIETVASALSLFMPTADVLVPEQCMTVYIGGHSYHVTVEQFPDRVEDAE